MPRAKLNKRLRSKGSRRAQPYKSSRAKDEQVRQEMKDTSGLYQITQKPPRRLEEKAVSVEDVAAGLQAL
ncbi:unnamed protein product [Rhizoctonia solani]|uniref:Uncharacterized protein n=1 Tax=Rhizoctonia solani TaxID=456999 RepID=A0A8H3CNC4_9AGAM|nr:unnamed protein product [Rhizoctonia solani]